MSAAPSRAGERGSSSSQCDSDEIRRALRLLHPAGAVVELRALRVEDGGYTSERYGFFNDPDQLVVAAKKVAAVAEGVYVTLNPVEPALLARANNRLKKAEKGRSAGDKNVLFRRWLLIDLDPTRPSGISSSDEELAIARVAAERVQERLTQRGWPEPAFACSGNGYHLLYRVDLPRDDDGLVQRVLLGLAKEFDTDRVIIDPSVFNPARITKLYGTMARKGDDTPLRRHRLARIERAPAELQVVPIEALQGAAEQAPTLRSTSSAPARTSASAVRHPNPLGDGFDVGAWISRHGVEADGPSVWPNGGPAAQRWRLATCPWNPEHTDGSAYIVQMAGGAVAAGCHHQSCKGRGWGDLRAAIEGLDLQPSVAVAPPAAPVKEIAELAMPDFPEQAFVGLLAEYADLVGPTTEAPRAFLWAACATALSVIIGRTATLPWGPGRMPPTLFVCCLGPTARARKSTALSDVVELLLRPLVGAQAGDRQVWVVDGSVSGEGIADALADRPAAGPGGAAVTGRRAILLYNELGAVLSKIDRDQAGNLMEFLMAMFDARPSWSSRTRSKDAPSFDITNGTLAILAASTLDWLAASTRELHITSGFINRFLFVGGVNAQSLPIRPEVPANAARALQERVRSRLLTLEGSFRLDAGAVRVHGDRYRAFQASTEAPLLQHATARQDAISLRVAMVLAAAEGSLVIQGHHIEAAWAVTDHSKATVQPLVTRAGQSRNAATEDRIRQAAERLVLAGRAQFRQRDLYQRLKGSRGMDSEQFSRMFRAMVAAGEFVEVGDGSYRLG